MGRVAIRRRAAAREAVPRGRAAAPPRPGKGDHERAWSVAGLVGIFAATLALAVIAFRFHPVGDYFTESDFYGVYARGAELVRQGRLDASRFGVYGPVYEVALALVATLVGEAFTAARVISVTSAAATLAVVWWAVRRRLGAAAAFWLVALMAVNPTVVRYGYSAGTDMLATCLALASMSVLLALEGWAGPVLGGVLVALATLTRYNHVTFMAAGTVGLLLATRLAWRTRWMRVGTFVGAFGVVAAPFTWWAVASGSPPGYTLTRDRLYLSSEPGQDIERRYRALVTSTDSAAAGTPARGDSAPGASRPARPVGRDLPGPTAGPEASAAPEAGAGLTPSPGIVRRLLTGIPFHLARDARDLLGWPAAALVVAALVTLAVRRRARPLLAFAPFAVFAFLALAPVFYSERYSMVLLPLYLAPAAVWLGRPDVTGAPRFLIHAAAVLCIGLVARDCFALQRMIHRSIPVEVLSAGKVLRSVAHPGARVVARKAHIAYVAGLEPVLMPFVDTLDSLAAFCRAKGVEYLYFSWYESRARPQFEFLLEPDLKVPGLTPLFVTRHHESVTYAIGPEFGYAPLWGLDVPAFHGAKVWIRTARDSGLYYAQRATNELVAMRAADALEWARAAARLLPRDADPHVLEGEALTRLRRPAEALAAFEGAVALDPRSPSARLGRGWSLLALGRRAEAASVWRPLIATTQDRMVLTAMADLYSELGDAQAAAEARRALASLGIGR